MKITERSRGAVGTVGAVGAPAAGRGTATASSVAASRATAATMAAPVTERALRMVPPRPPPGAASAGVSPPTFHVEPVQLGDGHGLGQRQFALYEPVVRGEDPSSAVGDGRDHDRPVLAGHA